MQNGHIIQMGLPEFTNTPLKKRQSWRPQSPQEEDNREVLYLMSRIKTLAKSGLTIIEVMSICVIRGVRPLQYRGKPMWHFNGEGDASCCGRKGLDSATSLARILSNLYKGEEEEFLRIKPRDGFSMYNPRSWVSCHLLLDSVHSNLPCHNYLPYRFKTGTKEGCERVQQPLSAARGSRPGSQFRT